MNFDVTYSRYLKRELLNPTFYKMPSADVRLRRNFDLSEIYCLRRRGKFRKYLNFLKKYAGVPISKKRLSKHTRMHIDALASDDNDNGFVNGRLLSNKSNKVSKAERKLKQMLLMRKGGELRRYFSLRKRGYLKFKRRSDINKNVRISSQFMDRYRGKKRVLESTEVYLMHGKGYNIYPEKRLRGRFHKDKFVR